MFGEQLVSECGALKDDPLSLKESSRLPTTSTGPSRPAVHVASMDGRW